MAIILTTKKENIPEEQFLNIYPNQFVKDSEKENSDWVKRNMDYFYTVAVHQFSRNHHHLTRNYELLKGILRWEDLYQEAEVKSFTEEVIDNLDLPKYVKHYPIMNPIINTLVGEQSKRPDNTYVKAFDDESKSEEGQFRTQLLQEYIIQKAEEELQALMAQHGVDMNDPEQLQQMTEEKVAEYLTSYSSLAEKWGSRMMEYLKMQFNIKEKSEESFRDLLIGAREFIHIFEDKSPIGFNIEVLNPKNVWWLTTPDEKYISDPLDKNNGSYAAGTIHIMEISEILNKFSLTDKEMKHLQEQSQQAYLINVRESNLVHTPKNSYGSITYDTYNPAILQDRLLMESQLKENRDELDNFLGITNSAGTFGNKYMVVRAYWCSKKRIGKLSYIDDQGNMQTTLVDENYINKSHPGQWEIEWGWTNQWYQGLRIGPDIYYVKPLEILDYCPIIGSVFENKNSEPKSLVDLMKPFQSMYNIFINKLYESIQKDWGNVILTSIRTIPTTKDGDEQDAIEQWEETAKTRGVTFIDDSPENTKSPSSFNQHQILQASRVQEMQGYYNMASAMKLECWELVGLNKERLGSIAATQTATATNTAVSQSYAQTEPWFSHHEYFMNKVYQAILDAAIYTQSKKPTSTLSYISNEGEKCFVEINGSDLKLKELGVLVTSRAEDAKTFQELRQLAQPMLQNGATPYEITMLYTTKSIRQLKDIFKAQKESVEKQKQTEMQQQQQQIDQQHQQAQQQMQLQQIQAEKQQAQDAYQKEQDRLAKIQVAIIQASKGTEGGSVPDESGLEMDRAKLDQQMQDNQRNYDLKLKQLQLQEQQLMHQQGMDNQNLQLAKDKLSAEKQRTKVMAKNKQQTKKK